MNRAPRCRRLSRAALLTMTVAGAIVATPVVLMLLIARLGAAR